MRRMRRGRLRHLDRHLEESAVRVLARCAMRGRLENLGGFTSSVMRRCVRRCGRRVRFLSSSNREAAWMLILVDASSAGSPHGWHAHRPEAQPPTPLSQWRFHQAALGQTGASMASQADFQTATLGLRRPRRHIFSSSHPTRTNAATPTAENKAYKRAPGYTTAEITNAVRTTATAFAFTPPDPLLDRPWYLPRLRFIFENPRHHPLIMALRTCTTTAFALAQAKTGGKARDFAHRYHTFACASARRLLPGASESAAIRASTPSLPAEWLCGP